MGYISLIGCALLTGILYLLGGLDIALMTLLTAIVLDYVTALMRAYITNTINPQTGLKGLIKKIGYLVLVAVAVLVDRVTGDMGAIRTVVMYYFAVNECISILENCAVMGLPVPNILKRKLERLQEEEVSDDESVQK